MLESWDYRWTQCRFYPPVIVPWLALVPDPLLGAAPELVLPPVTVPLLAPVPDPLLGAGWAPGVIMGVGAGWLAGGGWAFGL
jgi:hypothetical protein